jgi:uncharacterized protein RhaS with RHS repeats
MKEYEATILHCFDYPMYYAPYRNYSPDSARWLTRDPLGMIEGPNVYAYALGDPINATDALGLDTGRQFTNEQCREACEAIDESEGKLYKNCIEICNTQKGKTCNELRRRCTHIGAHDVYRKKQACDQLYHELCRPCSQ